MKLEFVAWCKQFVRDLFELRVYTPVRWLEIFLRRIIGRQRSRKANLEKHRSK
jgi:hypothetical protein